MDIAEIDGANKVHGAPEDWNEERNGECQPLPIRIEVLNGVAAVTYLGVEADR